MSHGPSAGPQHPGHPGQFEPLAHHYSTREQADSHSGQLPIGGSLPSIPSTSLYRHARHPLPLIFSDPTPPLPAAVLKTTLFYPLDLARVRITADTSLDGPHRVYPSVRTALYGTYRREGVRGLYRGLLLSMVGIVPYLSLSFTAYDYLKVGSEPGTKGKGEGGEGS